ncbi:hypothetical protein [Flavobacterium sp. SORGH_AS_0622]|uniref:hypothetical protein n=1 Tax=Flavobacterium sp. SORGH_AS_0622 TaxID=3041772 RepID=UPI00278A7F6C|nr:hypothetical protein [Flavobacterium sp. SORGH_AS_0622]MDQ1165901.1 peptidoglycan hydrolase CwlO-like protein [Flavobacterium sp. SORGH_AS_0622]
MNIEQLALTVISLLISIIGYFLKQLFEKIQKHDAMINQHATSIKVIETEHTNLNNKIDDLFTAIKEVSQEIKQLSKELSKKKDL